MKTSEQAKIWEKNLDRKAAKVRAERVLTQIKKYNPSAKKVLELGVGLGAVLVHFKRFEVSGLDLQKEYTQIAKKLVPKGKFYVQSMDKLHINDKFDVIFSVHECINEVKPYKNWEEVFAKSKNHLNKNGLFIFDMRTFEYLKNKKKEIVKLEKTPTGFMYDNTIIEGNKLIWDTTIFEKLKNGNYKIDNDKYFEEVYDVEKIKKSLNKYFKVLETKYFDNKQKLIFTCIKK